MIDTRISPFKVFIDDIDFFIKNLFIYFIILFHLMSFISPIYLSKKNKSIMIMVFIEN